MAATKTRWQTCAEPRDSGQWHTPPACQGQIVLVGYAYGDDGVIYRRTWDRPAGWRGSSDSSTAPE